MQTFEHKKNNLSLRLLHKHVPSKLHVFRNYKKFKILKITLLLYF